MGQDEYKAKEMGRPQHRTKENQKQFALQWNQKMRSEIAYADKIESLQSRSKSFFLSRSVGVDGRPSQQDDFLPEIYSLEPACCDTLWLHNPHRCA